MLSVLLDGRHCRPTLMVAKMTTYFVGRQKQRPTLTAVNVGRQCRLVCRGLNCIDHVH